MKTLFTFLNSKTKLKAAILFLGIVGCSQSFKAQTTAPGAALNFDGTNDNVDPNILVTSFMNNFTYEVWARPTATQDIDPQSTSGIAGISGQRYVIWPTWKNFDGGVGFSVGTNGVSVYEHGSNFINALLVYTVSLTGWNHIAVVVTNKQPTLYINGVLVATGLQSLHTNVYASLGDCNQFSGQVGGIGGGTYGYYQGDLDEFRLWSNIRTPAQITANRNVEFNCIPAGLFAYYKFNHGIAAGANASITSATDYSGNNYTGPLLNFALTTGTLSNWVAPGGVVTGAGAVSTVASSSVICVGQTATITASGATTYTWMPGSLTGPVIAVSPTVSTTYTASGTVSGGCTYSSANSISVNLCSGIEANNLQAESISVYPNPTSGSIYVNNLKENSQIEIINVLGSKVVSFHTQETNTIINLSNLSDGIYYLMIQNKTEKSIVKLVKN